MSKYLITIDGGTTNTRVYLWNEDGICLNSVKAEAGVRLTSMDGGSNAALKASIKEALGKLLENNKITYADVNAVYASGMITSREGLIELPHLTAPAGKKEFLENLVEVEIPDVCEKPIKFIRGLKNRDYTNPDLAQIEELDVMRGEETETLGLLDLFGYENGCLFALPGSHSKFVSVDDQGNMVGCISSLAGEILSAVTNYTILADTLGKGYAGADFDKEMLLAGFRTSRSTSFARAAFSTRMAQMFLHKEKKECAAFLLGAILENDIQAVKNSKALLVNKDTKVVIAGKEPFASALDLLFKEDGYFENIEIYRPTEERPMSGFGAFMAARAKGEI